MIRVSALGAVPVKLERATFNRQVPAHWLDGAGGRAAIGCGMSKAAHKIAHNAFTRILMGASANRLNSAMDRCARIVEQTQHPARRGRRYWEGASRPGGGSSRFAGDCEKEKPGLGIEWAGGSWTVIDAVPRPVLSTNHAATSAARTSAANALVRRRMAALMSESLARQLLRMC